MTLKQYYQTEHWKQLSRRLIKENNICEICHNEHYYIPKTKRGKKRLLRRFTCHHKHYNHLFKEQRSDIMVLCFSCHELGHHLEALAERDTIYIPILQEFKKASGWQAEKRGQTDELQK